MNTKSEALRLADALQQQAVWEGHYGPSYLRDLLPEAAAELRRQHEVVQRLLRERSINLESAQRDTTRIAELEKQRDELLTALKKLEYSSDGYVKRYPEEAEVNAVIAKAEKKQ